MYPQVRSRIFSRFFFFPQPVARSYGVLTAPYNTSYLFTQQALCRILARVVFRYVPVRIYNCARSWYTCRCAQRNNWIRNGEHTTTPPHCLFFFLVSYFFFIFYFFYIFFFPNNTILYIILYYTSSAQRRYIAPDVHEERIFFSLFIVIVIIFLFIIIISFSSHSACAAHRPSYRIVSY